MKTHTHSHATDDLHGANAVHKHCLLLVCFSYEVSHVGINLSAFPREIRFIINHQLKRETATHTHTHSACTEAMYNLRDVCASTCSDLLWARWVSPLSALPKPQTELHEHLDKIHTKATFYMMTHLRF